MARKNLKVPEPLFNALRDDKPDSMSWPTYLETRCLSDAGVSQPSYDTEELAREVAKQIDYAQIAGQVGEEVEGRLR
jgi:hypothetical protein